jgi:hypothetical protein
VTLIKTFFFKEKDFLNNKIAKYDKVRMTHGNNIPKHKKAQKHLRNESMK